MLEHALRAEHPSAGVRICAVLQANVAGRKRRESHLDGSHRRALHILQMCVCDHFWASNARFCFPKTHPFPPSTPYPCGLHFGMAYSAFHRRAVRDIRSVSARYTWGGVGSSRACCERLLLVVLPRLRDRLGQRVIRVGRAHQRLYAAITKGRGEGEKYRFRERRSVLHQPLRSCTHLSRTVRICSAGLHLSFKMSRQMRPSCGGRHTLQRPPVNHAQPAPPPRTLSTFGW